MVTAGAVGLLSSVAAGVLVVRALVVGIVAFGGTLLTGEVITRYLPELLSDDDSDPPRETGGGGSHIDIVVEEEEMASSPDDISFSAPYGVEEGLIEEVEESETPDELTATPLADSAGSDGVAVQLDDTMLDPMPDIDEFVGDQFDGSEPRDEGDVGDGQDLSIEVGESPLTTPAPTASVTADTRAASGFDGQTIAKALKTMLQRDDQ